MFPLLLSVRNITTIRFSDLLPCYHYTSPRHVSMYSAHHYIWSFSQPYKHLLMSCVLDIRESSGDTQK